MLLGDTFVLTSSDIKAFDFCFLFLISVPCLLMFQLFNKLVFLVSFVGNQGTFTRGYKAVVMDMLFIYHLGYAIICVLGLFVHEFFFSFLVRNLSHVSLLLHYFRGKHFE